MHKTITNPGFVDGGRRERMVVDGGGQWKTVVGGN